MVLLKWLALIPRQFFNFFVQRNFPLLVILNTEFRGRIIKQIKSELVIWVHVQELSRVEIPNWQHMEESSKFLEFGMVGNQTEPLTLG